MSRRNKELNERLTRLVWLYHRYYHHNHMQHGPMGDPQRGQGRILATLKSQPEISQKDLGYLLDITAQSLGTFLSKLEKKGFITRTPSEIDRRVINIKLTKAGREVAGQEISYDRIFDCLNNEEQDHLSEYFKRIIETFITELGEEPHEEDNAPHLPGVQPFEDHFNQYLRWGEINGFEKK